jgi:hypothetical protein
MLKVIRSVFTAERMEEVATMIYLKAIHGDVVAAKIMFNYGAGKGVPEVDPDRLDIDEWHLTVEEAVDARDMKAIMTRLPVGCANHITRAALPVLGQEMMATLGQGLKVDPKDLRRWIKKRQHKAEHERRVAERARRRAERAQQQAAENAGPSANHENECTAPQQGYSPPLPDGRCSSAAPPSPNGDIGCSPPLPDARGSSPHEDPREGPPIAHGDNGAPTSASDG